MIGKFDVREVLRRLGVAWREVPGGQRLVIRCPMGTHDDSHPSTHLAATGPRAGLWRCRSCSEGGDLVTLVCVARKLGSHRDPAAFRAALAWLRAEVALVPEEYRAARVVLGSAVRRPYELPPEVFLLPLPMWPSVARDYLAGRGVTAEQVLRHRIGFAVDGRKLAGRIVLPTLRADGTPASYAARSFVGEEPRYQTPGPDDGADTSVLFGEHTWSGGRRVYVAEGGFDLLAVERALGVGTQLAGLSGSNISTTTMAKVSAFPEVVLVTDPDRAGNAAAAKLRAALLRHRRTLRVSLPSGIDANRFEQDCGADALRRILLAAA